MDLRRRHLGQSLHIFHSPGAEGRVLVVTVAREYRKHLEEEATVSGYGRSKRTSMLRCGHIILTYWPLGQSGPRGQYPVRYS